MATHEWKKLAGLGWHVRAKPWKQQIEAEGWPSQMCALKWGNAGGQHCEEALVHSLEICITIWSFCAPVHTVGEKNKELELYM